MNPILRAAAILELTWEVHGMGQPWPEKAKECQAALVKNGLTPGEAALATFAGRRLVVSRIRREIERLEG